MQLINLDRLASLTPCTPKANQYKKCSSLSERMGCKVKKLFRPEYTSTPTYKLPKTSTPVIDRSNTPLSSISIVISSRKTSLKNFQRVNSTFRDDAKFKRLIAKKLFDEQQKILTKVPRKLSKTSQTRAKLSTNKHEIKPLGHRIKKISNQQIYDHQKSFIIKSAKLVEELCIKKSSQSCTRCRPQTSELNDANYLVRKLFYKPNTDMIERLKSRSIKRRKRENEHFLFADSNENLIKLENINFNFYSRH